jgi:oligosaccharide 4-alpha-D-glucosyltransferase
LKTQFYPEGYSALDTSFTVTAEAGQVNPNLNEEASSISFYSSDLEVFIKKSPLKLSFVKSGDTILCDEEGFQALVQGGENSFKIKENEHFYGTGSRAIPLDRRGRDLYFYNQAQYGYSNNVPVLNINIPFVVSDKGYGLFYDNRSPLHFDIGANTENVFKITCDGGNLRYYVIAGNDYADILNEYTWLTGRQPMPPLWSLGYIQSKYGYENETQARSIVNDLKQDDFPIDALVLDLYWFGSTSDMGNLDWDYSKWTDPEGMLNDFKNENIKTILITEPYFTLNSTNYSYLSDNGLLATNSGGTPFVFYGFWAGDASLIDITKKETTDWMWNFYKNRRNEGVAGWWCDLGEPESHPSEIQHSLGTANSVHNIYSLQWAKMLHEGYENEFSDERLFNLIRSGFAGMQRYSTFPWSGDIQRSWEGLNSQIPIMLGMGMSGVGYMHSDAGGFTGEELNGELFARWIQMATFSPILRVHGVGTVEPIYYAEPYKSIARNYIKFRYQMLPYNYTLAWENSLNGIPLARQLNFYEPTNEALSNINDEYFWGDNLLVAPILQSGVSSREVVFPEGRWMDYFTNEVYEGSSSHTVACNIENTLLFAKAGSFIPMASPYLKNTSEYTSDSLVVNYFPEESVNTSEYTLFCDNGKSTGSLVNNEFELITFEGIYGANNLEIKLSKSGTTYPGAPVTRNIRFEVRRIAGKPSQLTINSANTTEVADLASFSSTAPAWFWNSTESKLYVHLNWTGASTSIKINSATLGVNNVISSSLNDYSLNNPYPMPFTNFVNISYNVKRAGNYQLFVYDTNGKILMKADLGNKTIGTYIHKLNTADWSSGIYTVELKADNESIAMKLLKQ